AGPYSKAMRSCGLEKPLQRRNRLVVLEAIRHHAQSKSRDARLSVLAGDSVGHHPWQIDYFGNPAAVIFALELDSQLALLNHAGVLLPRLLPQYGVHRRLGVNTAEARCVAAQEALANRMARSRF